HRHHFGVGHEARGHTVGGGFGFRVSSDHRGRRGEKVLVVAVVHQVVHAAFLGSFAGVRAIDLGGFRVAFGGLIVKTGAGVDMRGHMHEVTSLRNHGVEATGAGQGAFGTQRGFDGVNVEVIGADVM